MTSLTNAPSQGDGSFDSGVKLLDAGGDWTLLANIDLRGRPGHLIFEGVITGAALTGLKLTQAATPRGTHRDVYTAWSSVSRKVPVILPDANIATSSTWFQVEVESGAAPEVAVWAKGAGASVRLRGTAAYVESPQTLFAT